MEMESLKILYDHYKESNSLRKQAEKDRNKFFVLLCVFEMLSFLVWVNPVKAMALMTLAIILGSGIDGKDTLDTISGWDAQFLFGNTVLQTFLWVLIVYATVRYVQATMYVERQYSYLDSLENAISQKTNGMIFSREGANYRGNNNYPMVLNFIDLYYKMFSPILFLAINTMRIRMEWTQQSTVTLSLICDSILYLAVLIVTWFYFFEIHSTITTWCKRHIPFLNRIATALRNLLKAV